jgi:hypothetical protein
MFWANLKIGEDASRSKYSRTNRTNLYLRGRDRFYTEGRGLSIVTADLENIQKNRIPESSREEKDRDSG